MDYESDEEIRELLEEEIEGGWEYDELIPSDNENNNNNNNTQLFQHPFLNNEKVEEIKEMGENEDIGEEEGKEEEHISRGDQIGDERDEEEADRKQIQEEEEDNLEEEDIEGIESLMNKIKENISQDNLMDINNDREVVSWQVFNSEISTLKDDLAVTSSVGTKGGKKLGRRVRGGKKGGRRKNTSRNREISPEIKFMLGEVNYYYIQQEYSSALKILFDIVKIDPTIYEAWFVMGLIYEDCEFKVKALNVLFIAAYISQNDNALWKKVARLSKDEDLLEQASYCYSKAILSDKTDIEAMKEKAELAIEMDYLYTAIHNYKQILKITPYNLELMNDLILLIVKNEGDLTEAIPYIDEAILQHLTNEEFKGELKYCYLNIATDVYLLNGQYIKALRRIIRGCYCISETNWNEWNESAHSLESLIEITNQFLYFDLPIEIKMKIGTLLALLNLDLEAEEYFKYLLLLDVNTYFNTFIEVGKALITKNKIEKGLDILLYLEQNCNETVNVELLITIGEGFEKLNEDEKAIEYYLKADNFTDGILEISLALERLYIKINKSDIAKYYTSRIANFKNELIKEKKKKKNLRNKNKNKRTTKTNNELNEHIIFNEITNNEIEIDDDDEIKDPDYIDEGPDSEEEEEEEEYKINVIRSFKGNNFKQIREKELKNRGTRRKRIGKNKLRNNQLLINKLIIKLESLDLNQILENEEYGRFFIKMYYQVYREFILEIYKKEKYKQIKGSEKVLNIYLDLKYDSSFKTLICSIELRRWLKLILKAINIMIHYNLLNELLAMLSSITLSQCFRTLKKLKLFFLMLYIGSNEKSQNYELSIDLARKVCTDAVIYYPGEKYSFLLALSSGSKERQMNANTRSKLLKYLRRKIDSNVQDYYTYYFYGHLRSLSKSYTLAIKSFQQALNQLENQQILTNSQLEAKQDNQAQLYLYLAITHFHEAIKRTSNNRQYEILLGFSYLKKYAKLKNYTQQVYFNLARAYHHFNLLPMAVKHYKKVLQLSEMEEIEDKFDLKFEAAYNLSNLFLSVNNHSLAYYYRIKYLKY